MVEKTLAEVVKAHADALAAADMFDRVKRDISIQIFGMPAIDAFDEVVDVIRRRLEVDLVDAIELAELHLKSRVIETGRSAWLARPEDERLALAREMIPVEIEEEPPLQVEEEDEPAHETHRTKPASTRVSRRRR